MLDIALRHAEQAGARQVTALHLVLGQLSSIVDDSVQFYWDIIAEGTAAEGAKLHFQRIPAELLCLDCSKSYALNGIELACPSCGGAHIKVVNGEQFQLKAIDVEYGLASQEAAQGVPL